MFDNHNSNNGQRPTRCKFGLKFTPKPANPELSVQENIMNFINDYRQWEKDNQQPDYSHLSTREAVKRIVEDFRTQEREEEEQKAMQAQMQRPYGSGQTSYAPAQGFYGTQQNANMSPQRSYVPAGQATYGATEPNGAARQDIGRPQESGWQKVVRNADYMSTAARQGLSYGWSDEVEGVLGGVGYAVGSLVPSWNKNNESMSEAFKRGYITHRDEERQKLEQARQNAPTLTTAFEAVGAMASPFGASRLANAPYRNVVKKIPLKKAAAYGSFYGTGTTEHGNTLGETLGNYAENMSVGAVGGVTGYGLNKQFFGYAGGVPLVRKALETTIDTTMNKLYNSVKRN